MSLSLKLDCSEWETWRWTAPSTTSSTASSHATLHELFEATAASSACTHLLSHEHLEDLARVDIHLLLTTTTHAAHSSHSSHAAHTAHTAHVTHTSWHTIEGELHATRHSAHTCERIASAAWVVRVHAQIVLLSLLFVREDIIGFINQFELLLCFRLLVIISLGMSIWVPFAG